MTGSSDNRSEPNGDSRPHHAKQQRPVGLDARDQAALAFWSNKYGRAITTVELYEIRSNLSGLIKLMIKIDNRNRFAQTKKEKHNERIEDVGTDTGSVPRRLGEPGPQREDAAKAEGQSRPDGDGV